MASCPSLSQIIQYRDDRTNAPPEVRDHVRQCERCRQTLDEITDADTLARQIRRADEQTREYGQPPLPMISDYGLVREVGRGGGGVVYEAIQHSLNRPVALKILPTMLRSLRPDSAERFKAEAAAAARLQHPHIVPIYDYGEEGGCQYYAMELVRGMALNEVAKHYAGLGWRGNLDAGQHCTPDACEPSAGEVQQHLQVPLPSTREAYYKEVARWIAEVATALQFAHDRGMIHRDIKPSNLILSATGRIVVTDFGLAKDVGSEAVTKSGHLLGTLRYMSPEQVRQGHDAIDHRSDVYSLGVTLYELLTLQPAMPGPDDHLMLQTVLEYHPPDPRKIMPQVPADLEVVCTKAMAKERRQRYQSAGDFHEDLQRFLANEPIRARPPEMHTRAMRFLRRHRSVLAFVVVGVLLTTSVIFAALYITAQRENAERRNAVVAELVTNARGHLDAGRHNMAASVYTTALTLDPNLTYVYLSRAIAYGELNKLDLAIQDLSSAIELSPQRPYSHFQRAVLLWMSGDLDAARTDLELALTLMPTLFDAHLCHYFLDREVGLTGGAHTLAELAAEVEEGARRQLLNCLRSGSDPQEVLAQTDSPRFRRLAYWALAEQAALDDRVDQAARWYQQAVDAGTGSDVIRLFCRWRLRQSKAEP